MSCCGGNCGCGANCGCGNGCKGCGRTLDLSFSEKTVEAQVFAATASDMVNFDDSATVAGESGCCASGGCKCGANCTCESGKEWDVDSVLTFSAANCNLCSLLSYKKLHQLQGESHDQPAEV